ncbi:MAG: hypothetical protein IJJ33_04815 [Victivallales bacterium]|nr:hypothetical protein [Victivallales bacterium]
MTEKYGLIGRKLGHSYSQLIHHAFGQYSYFMQELEPEEVPDFIRHGDFRGLNVTIPYKKVALECCDVVTSEARRIGSVNTVVRGTDGLLHGHNTDYAGFSYMAERAGIRWPGAKVLVLGTGGASLTVHAVLADQGVRCAVAVSRQGPVDYSNVAQLHGDAEIVVNTTPVGMFPDNGGCPVDLALFPRLTGVLDLIYNPMRTRLVQSALERGLATGDGLLMLVEQGRVAAGHFLGKELPRELTPRTVARIRRDTANIALVGMPGCGKTAIGTLLAKALRRELVDTDQLIVEDAGCSIAEIFAREGEGAFRAREEAAVAAAAKRSGVVIATGGGAVLREENRRNLRGNSYVVWLKRELAQVELNVGRPLSTDLDAVRGMYGIREPLYRGVADCIVENDRLPEQASAQIISWLMKDAKEPQ